MRWVQHAALSPHRCAALPYIGNSSTRKGFIDTGSELDGEHVYISVEFLEAAVPAIGFVPRGAVTGLGEQIEALKAQILEVEEERDELKRQMGAVSILREAGYTASRKPGRPKQKAGV